LAGAWRPESGILLADCGGGEGHGVEFSQVVSDFSKD